MKDKTIEGIKAAFQAVKEKLSNITRCKDNSSYIYTETLYNATKNFVVFVSFSNDYLSDGAELLGAITNCNAIKAKYNHIQYDEYLDNDNGGYNVIEHRKYYIILSGDSHAYNMFYKEISNLANPLLKAISKEIFNSRVSSDFEDLIKDNIFNIGDFKSNNPQYDEYIKAAEYCYHDNISLIIKRLPSSFSTIDLLEIVNCYDREFIATSALDMIHEACNSNRCKCLIGTVFSKFFNALLHDISDETLYKIIGPKYKIDADMGFYGIYSDAEVDDIFKEQYDKFSAIANPNIHYEDIDEILENLEDDDINIYSDSSMIKKGVK